ncbi:hypothetical protein Athai_14050 [Actinocatenispora thailandica]|uniref:DUF3592 domain-containing protein n=1 Tax=Actinocatenispora thailandica TaxID=227318 RepID=A0A7R7DM56_9ACTN|nr:DUF3592 domain-containing protein [Actinocatenispora thailandica]BCJ33902.1 hypothetical protein Athai_14050 [Actinocatenispora thailandica]
MGSGGQVGLRRFGARVNIGAKLALMAALFALLAGFGYWCVLDGRHRLHDAAVIAARGRTVPGTIVATRRDRGPQSNTRWVRVRYTTPAGTYEYWQAGGEHVGDVVRVHYVPGRPATATIRSDAYSRAGDIGEIVIGAGIMLVPLVLIVAAAADRDNRNAVRRFAAALRRSAWLAARPTSSSAAPRRAPGPRHPGQGADGGAAARST